MQRQQERLGEILIGQGLIHAEQLKAALEEQAGTKEFLGSILVKKKQIKEDDLLLALSKQFDLPVVDLRYKYIDWNFVKNFSPSLILDHHCFPVEGDDFSVTIAISNPLDIWAMKEAEGAARGFKLKLVLVSENDIQEAAERYRQYIQKKITR